MHPILMLRASLLSITVLVFATASFAQTSAHSAPQPAPLATEAQPTERIEQADTKIIYTGKLMGYFRAPSDQFRNRQAGCPASPVNSPAAVTFQTMRDHN